MLGNIDTENAVCTNICSRAGCVVITVDYRFVPFPIVFLLLRYDVVFTNPLRQTRA